MNYGPLALAIQVLVEANVARAKAKSYHDFEELDRNVRRAGDAVARAQDDLVAEVKAGTIE